MCAVLTESASKSTLNNVKATLASGSDADHLAKVERLSFLHCVQRSFFGQRKVLLLDLGGLDLGVFSFAASEVLQPVLKSELHKKILAQNVYFTSALEEKCVLVQLHSDGALNDCHKIGNARELLQKLSVQVKQLAVIVEENASLDEWLCESNLREALKTDVEAIVKLLHQAMEQRLQGATAECAKLAQTMQWKDTVRDGWTMEAIMSAAQKSDLLSISFASARKAAFLGINKDCSKRQSIVEEFPNTSLCCHGTHAVTFLDLDRRGPKTGWSVCTLATQLKPNPSN
eukprot:5550507-Amphidinium_carterae.3